MSSQAGRLAFGLAGASIGSFFGAPGLGATAGLFIGGLVFQDDVNQIIEGPSPADVQITQSAQGIAIPVVYGTYKMAGNVIWTTGSRKDRVETTQSQSVGGKGGGASQSITTVEIKNRISIAYGICEGVVELIEVWADGDKIFDKSGDIQNSNLMGEFEFFDGTETQNPSPVIEAVEGVGNVPPHRGLAYIVFDDLDLSPFGNRLPNIRFLVTSQAVSSNARIIIPPVTGAGSHFDGIDGSALDVDGTSMLIRAQENGVTVLKKYNFFSGQYESSVPMPVSGFFRNYAFDDRFVYHSTGAANFTNIIKRDRITGDQVGISNTTVGNSSSIYAYRKRFPVAGTLVEGIGQIYYNGSGIFGGSIHSFDADSMIRQWVVAHTTFGNATTVDWSTLDKAEGSFYSIQDGNPSFVTKMDTTGTVSWSVDITASTGLTGGRIKWIRDTDNILIIQGTTVAEIDGDDGSFIKSATLAGAVGTGQDQAWENDPARGLFFYGTGTHIVELDIFNLTSRLILNTSVTPNGTNGDTATYNPFRNIVYTNAFLIFNIEGWELNRRSVASVTLDTILADLCTRAGIPSSRFDVTDTASISVRGYAVTQPSNVASNIKPLLEAFFVFAVESDGQLKFKKLSTTSILTVDETVLRAGTPDRVESLIVETRTQDIEMPDGVSVRYIDFNEQYQQGIQQAKRRVGNSQNNPVITSPIVFTASEANTIANRLLYQAWARRRLFAFSLPLSLMKVEPGDVITITIATSEVTFNGKVWLTKVEFINNVIFCEAVAIEPTNFTQTVISNDPSSLNDSTQGIRLTLPSTLYFLDINLLRDVDNFEGYYAGLADMSDRESYPGGTLFEKFADDSIPKVADFGASVIVGLLKTNVGAFGKNIFDETSVIDVEFFDPDITFLSNTEQDVLNGRGAMLIGRFDLGFEILQYQTATNINTQGINKWRFTRFLRGRRGTEQFETHSTNETVIMIPNGAASGIINIFDPIANLNIQRDFRPVTFGFIPSQVADVERTNTFARLKPFAPGQFVAEKETDNDVKFDWIRRDRLGNEWLAFQDAPLSEATEDYEIDIILSSAVVRTIPITSAQTITYSEADQITDGTTGGFDAEIFQLSANVGRGYKSILTV